MTSTQQSLSQYCVVNDIFSKDNRRPMLDSCFVHVGQCNVSVNIALLFWPIDFRNGNGSENCMVTPITPQLNCRDVTDARLQDPLSIQMIDGTDCHVMFGSICAKEDQEFDGMKLRMSSIFDVYEEEGDKYFSKHIKVLEIRSKLKLFVGKIKAPSNTEEEKNKFKEWIADRKQWIQKTSDPSSLLIGFMHILKCVFHEFRREDDYESLKQVLMRCWTKTQNQPDLPDNLKNAVLALQVTYLFQKFMHPVCVTIMNGNHRHARMFYELFRLARVPSQTVAEGNINYSSEMMTRVELLHVDNITELHWVQENSTNGYLIAPPTTTTSSSSVPPVNMDYKIYSIECSSSAEISREQLQFVSTKENNVLEATVSREVCHLILSKCNEVLRLSKGLDDDMSQGICSSDMKQKMRSYMRATDSDIHNNNRVSSSSLNQMRHQKTALRELMFNVFLPGNGADSKYKNGRTYCEYSSKQLKGIFKDTNGVGIDATILHSSKMYGFFILLDSIFVVDEIRSFMKMICSCYKSLHVNASMSHNINHTVLWDSGHVVEHMNDFIEVMIRIMKNPGTMQVLRHDIGDGFEELCPELVEQEDDDSTHRKAKEDKWETFKQKVSHFCQQYAFFAALTVANMIGFYPYLPGCTWKVGDGKKKNQVCDYNIFSLLLHLLSLSRDSDDDDEEESFRTEPPKTMFIKMVISDFISKLFREATNVSVQSDAIFPFTYKEFYDGGCSLNVIHFFKNCVIQQSPAICEFFSALSQDDRKREAMKRKAMNSHKRKNAKRKTEGERNNDVEDDSTNNNVDTNGNAGDGNNPHPTGVGNNGADEGQTLNDTSQRATSPTSVMDEFSRAPDMGQNNSDNCGVIKGEIAPYFSASTQLIVRGLGLDALSLMNEDMNCVMGQTMKMIVQALVNNSNVSITADTVEMMNNLKASSSQDIYCFLSQAISNFWTKVAIQEKAVSDGDSHTKDLPFIQIPNVAKARDLNAAMKYFSCTEWKNVNFTPHSDYFLVSAPRPPRNGLPTTTVPSAIAGVEAIQIASTSNSSIFAKLVSFIVHVGK